jgi:hypothetical protein
VPNVGTFSRVTKPWVPASSGVVWNGASPPEAVELTGKFADEVVPAT